MLHEERLDVVAGRRVAERAERRRDGCVAAEDGDLRLEIRPVLLDERPGAGAGVVLLEEARQEGRRVLAAQLRRQRICQRAIDERRIRELRERIEIPVLLVPGART